MKKNQKIFWSEERSSGMYEDELWDVHIFHWQYREKPAKPSAPRAQNLQVHHI